MTAEGEPRRLGKDEFRPFGNLLGVAGREVVDGEGIRGSTSC